MLTPIAAANHLCKVCGAPSALYGVVDFNKNCEDRRQPPMPISGVPVYYHRCSACGFIFTAAFDAWTHRQFAEHIYNDGYVLVDPDYPTDRPQTNAVSLGDHLLAGQQSLRILDYGGGSGMLTELLKKRGFSNTFSYDPIIPEYAARPEGLFDCIVSFEVLEHSPDPRATLNDIVSMLKTPGIVLLSTLLQPPEIDQYGVRWWYVAPRNGHISIFSRPAMNKLSESLKMTFGSFNENWHVLFREIPGFAKPWFGQGQK
jgi:2-polyprenyl-6-hydroxyphenyl methylase/3-demethylubiquinone-9 3-methyltransferase